MCYRRRRQNLHSYWIILQIILLYYFNLFVWDSFVDVVTLITDPVRFSFLPGPKAFLSDHASNAILRYMYVG